MSEMDVLLKSFSEMKSNYIKREGALEAIKKQKDEKIENNKLLEKEKEGLEFEFRLFKTTGEEARKYAADFFCTLASSGAQTVFGDNKKICHKMYESGGNPFLDFEIINKFDDGYEVSTSPTDSSGGGVADIVALSAFSALSYLANNGNTASWFLDEPNKFVSAGNDEKAAEFVYSLAHEFQRQIIMVSHRPSSIDYSDKTYRITLNDKGESIAEDVTNYSKIQETNEE